MSNQDNGLVLVALKARVLRTSEGLSPVVFLDAKNDRWLNVADDRTCQRSPSLSDTIR